MSTVDASVRDDRSRQRLLIEQDGATAQLVYDTEPGRLILLHTEVPDSLSGQGIGARLVAAAVGRARADGLTIVPWCPFTRRWLRDHPEATTDVDIDWRTLPPASATEIR